MWYSFMFGQMIRIIFKEDDQIYTKNKQYELNYRFNRHKKLLDAIEYDKMTVYNTYIYYVDNMSIKISEKYMHTFTNFVQSDIVSGYIVHKLIYIILDNN